MTDDRNASLPELLGTGDCPVGLYTVLSKRWKVLDDDDDVLSDTST